MLLLETTGLLGYYRTLALPKLSFTPDKRADILLGRMRKSESPLSVLSGG